MSASMLLAAIAVPADREEPLLDFDAGRAAVAELTDHTTLDLDDPHGELEQLIPDFTPELFLDDDGKPILDAIKMASRAFIEDLENALDDTDEIETLTVAGYRLIISGGLTWGDAPSDAAEAIWRAQKLPVPVLTALGIIPDFSEPLAQIAELDSAT